MPTRWAHWLIGSASPLPREWGVAGYPTYILLDANGMMHARSHHFDEAMRDDIRRLLRAMR